MKKLSVETSQVSSVATNLEKLAESYTNAYKEIFKQLRLIDNNWDGVDNDEFNKKFNFLEKDFIEMTTFLERTVNHLRLSGESYKTVEGAVSRIAGKLKG